MNNWNKLLSFVLIGTIIAAIVAIIYLAVTPSPKEKFTEFYILGLGGKADDYPQEIVVGRQAKVILGIVNREHQPASYRVDIKINGQLNTQLDIGSLSHTQKWEKVVSFTPKEVGDKRKVEFYLYKDDQPEPYHKDPLRLYIDVKPPP